MGRIFATLMLTSLAASWIPAGDVKYVLTGDNTKIGFECSKLTTPVVSHVGGFKKLTGSATYNGTDLTTLKFVVDIDLNSMFTDTDKVTSHLMSPDFFDVKSNPNAKFTSSKVEKEGDAYKVTGKLTMHGKTKDVTFPAKLALKDGSLTMASKFKINRHDWAISYGKGFVIDDVSMDVSITAKK